MDPESIARTILAAFERYQQEFRELTLGARLRFERQDWARARADWVARLELYGRVVADTLRELHHVSGPAVLEDRDRWKEARQHYGDLVSCRHGVELAETFFNSVVRRIFTIVGVEPEIEFLDMRPSSCPAGPAAPVTRTFVRTASLTELVRQILDSYWFSNGYEDAGRDAQLIADQIEQQAPGIDSIEMVVPVFYRNKGAYLVGRMRRHHAPVPLVIALLNGDRGVAADAVLLTEDEVSVVFSFTRSYFFVDVPCPHELVRFLRVIMPRKPVAELYTAIGYNRHGKTEFYRSLQQHLRTSSDRFDFGRGARGMVMIVFSMPTYDVIFKVVRDHFVQPKTCTRRDVMEKYQLVFKHDRAGRLVDAQEFEYLRFERDRFAPDLLDQLQKEAGESVVIDDESVVLRHVYTERRLTPLDVYLSEATADAARDAVIDYGRAVRELAASNIFPGDLLLKNFGVTRHGRVVFYDYDELCLLTDCTFRRMPVALNEEDELAAEPWFYVGARDIFPEEFLPFLGFPGGLKEQFVAVHGDLLRPEFWCAMQEEQRRGQIVDLFPYGPQQRLRPAA